MDLKDFSPQATEEKRNTNYHELSMNGWRSNYMMNYMAIIC